MNINDDDWTPENETVVLRGIFSFLFSYVFLFPQLWFEPKREGFSSVGACQAMSLCKILRDLYSLGLLCLIRFHENLGKEKL